MPDATTTMVANPPTWISSIVCPLGLPVLLPVIGVCKLFERAQIIHCNITTRRKCHGGWLTWCPACLLDEKGGDGRAEEIPEEVEERDIEVPIVKEEVQQKYDNHSSKVYDTEFVEEESESEASLQEAQASHQRQASLNHIHLYTKEQSTRLRKSFMSSAIGEVHGFRPDQLTQPNTPKPTWDTSKLQNFIISDFPNFQDQIVDDSTLVATSTTMKSQALGQESKDVIRSPELNSDGAVTIPQLLSQAVEEVEEHLEDSASADAFVMFDPGDAWEDKPEALIRTFGRHSVCKPQDAASDDNDDAQDESAVDESVLLDTPIRAGASPIFPAMKSKIVRGKSPKSFVFTTTSRGIIKIREKLIASTKDAPLEPLQQLLPGIGQLEAAREEPANLAKPNVTPENGVLLNKATHVQVSQHRASINEFAEQYLEQNSPEVYAPNAETPAAKVIDDILKSSNLEASLQASRGSNQIKETLEELVHGGEPAVTSECRGLPKKLGSIAKDDERAGFDEDGMFSIVEPPINLELDEFRKNEKRELWSGWKGKGKADLESTTEDPTEPMNNEDPTGRYSESAMSGPMAGHIKELSSTEPGDSDLSQEKILMLIREDVGLRLPEDIPNSHDSSSTTPTSPCDTVSTNVTEEDDGLSDKVHNTQAVFSTNDEDTETNGCPKQPEKNSSAILQLVDGNVQPLENAVPRKKQKKVLTREQQRKENDRKRAQRDRKKEAARAARASVPVVHLPQVDNRRPIDRAQGDGASEESTSQYSRLVSRGLGSQLGDGPERQTLEEANLFSDGKYLLKVRLPSFTIDGFMPPMQVALNRFMSSAQGTRSEQPTRTDKGKKRVRFVKDVEREQANSSSRGVTQPSLFQSADMNISGLSDLGSFAWQLEPGLGEWQRHRQATRSVVQLRLLLEAQDPYLRDLNHYLLVDRPLNKFQIAQIGTTEVRTPPYVPFTWQWNPYLQSRGQHQATAQRVDQHNQHVDPRNVRLGPSLKYGNTNQTEGEARSPNENSSDALPPIDENAQPPNNMTNIQTLPTINESESKREQMQNQHCNYLRISNAGSVRVEEVQRHAFEFRSKAELRAAILRPENAGKVLWLIINGTPTPHFAPLARKQEKKSGKAFARYKDFSSVTFPNASMQPEYSPTVQQISFISWGPCKTLKQEVDHLWSHHLGTVPLEITREERLQQASPRRRSFSEEQSMYTERYGEDLCEEERAHENCARGEYCHNCRKLLDRAVRRKTYDLASAGESL